jgi:hypothetical protein
MPCTSWCWPVLAYRSCTATAISCSASALLPAVARLSRTRPFRPVALPTWQFVLSHGDALCTDDQEYQSFRALVRQADWQQAFLARPLVERRAIARELRQQSEFAKRDKADYLMDVNAGATDDFLRRMATQA